MASLLKFPLFKTSRRTPSGFRRHHFLNTLPRERLNEILSFSESDQLGELVSKLDLAKKRVLFLHDSCPRFLIKKLAAKEEAHVVHALIKTQITVPAHPTQLTVLVDIDRLPFLDKAFDVVVCPLATHSDSVNEALINKLSKKLKQGGRLLMSLRHPHLEKILFNQNPSVSGFEENNISKYFRLIKKHNLYTEDLVEGRVDLSLKPFFAFGGSDDHYYDYKNTPLTLEFQAVKYQKA